MSQRFAQRHRNAAIALADDTSDLATMTLATEHLPQDKAAAAIAAYGAALMLSALAELPYTPEEVVASVGRGLGVPRQRHPDMNEPFII